MESTPSFQIAFEHAQWCADRRQSPEEVLRSIGGELLPHEVPPDWSEVIEALARAHSTLDRV